MSPLVEIHFSWPDDGLIVVRHWYHVPRQGDMVDLVIDGESERVGVVQTVYWSDKEETVVVRLK